MQRSEERKDPKQASVGVDFVMDSAGFLKKDTDFDSGRRKKTGGFPGWSSQEGTPATLAASRRQMRDDWQVRD